MADVVVTVPQSFGLDAWVEEGDLPGQVWTGEEWHFYLSGPAPKIQPGERVYVVYKGKLRGYAPLVRVERYGPHSYALVRHNNAVAVTIDEPTPGFRGFKYRWWDQAKEKPFPNWTVA